MTTASRASSRKGKNADALIPAPLCIEDIAQRILIVRGRRVLLDADLAAFYGESTKRFNQQVNRNIERFPNDLMFQWNKAEFANLRLQFATSSLKDAGHGDRRYAPLAFTEHGAIMASMVLGSPRATIWKRRASSRRREGRAKPIFKLPCPAEAHGLGFCGVFCLGAACTNGSRRNRISTLRR